MSYYGYYEVSSGQVLNDITLDYGTIYVYSGGTANKTTVNDGGWMCVSSGGAANRNTLNEDGEMMICSGGTANSTTINDDGELYIEAGGVANNIKLNPGGELYISSGAKANTVTVSKKGEMFVFAGASALKVSWTPCVGFVAVDSGTVTFAKNYKGVYFGRSGTVTYSSSMTGNNAKLSDWNTMCVMNSGRANSVTVNKNGMLFVYSGGTAMSIRENGGVVTVANGAKVSFIPTTLNKLVLDEAFATLHSGTTANSTTLRDGTLYILGGVANKTVSDDGNIYIYHGGVANSTNMLEGEMEIYSGGVANNTTLSKGASLYVFAGAVVNNTVVNHDLEIDFGGVAKATTVGKKGRLRISSGGRHSGKLTVSAGGGVYWENGSILDFDISGVKPGNSAQVNNLALALEASAYYGSPDYYVTVSSTQTSGTYTLAGGAANFDSTITVYAAKKKLGTVTVGNTLDSSIGTYTLTRSGGKLQLKVVGFGPAAPTVKASTTKATNQNITITATFTKDSVKKQYSTDGKSWKSYTQALSVGKNGTYYFRGINAGDNASKVTSIKVSNIDKVAPTAPTVKVSTTKATNQDVTVTADFSADSSKKQYSTDKKTWKTYSKALTATKNGTYYFRGTDAAGNVSKVTSIKVANIDKVAPTAPTVKVSSTKLTNKNITITATFSDDSAKKQYSTDNKTWSTYSKAVSVGKNGTYYFRGVDAAGNASKVTSVKVTNIDKTPPTAPTVKASTAEPTNKSVTVTATYSSDSAKKQYSTDNKTWKNYTKALSTGKNTTYYFRALDALGNVSEVTTYKVTNIDKTAPAAPTLEASTTDPTNQDVTLTAIFSEDSAKRQYSADNKTWQDCADTVAVGENGTYYFRSIDAAGNVSKVTSIVVANIDKVAPAAPTATLSTTDPTDQTVTVTAAFSADSVQKQYSLDGETWEDYTVPLILNDNAVVGLRGIDAAGNASVTDVVVDNIMNTGNNDWDTATVLAGDIFAAVDNSFDAADCYDIDEFAALAICMERGQVTATFCNADGDAIESFEIACGDDPEQNARYFDAIADEVKFLRIEAAATGISSYHLTPNLA